MMLILQICIWGILCIVGQTTVSQHQNWSSTSNIVQSSSSSIHAKKFACTEEIGEPVDYFFLNVSLNSSARLNLHSHAMHVSLRSDDNLWHYIKTYADRGPFTTIDVNFMLLYEDMAPSGNCSFQFYIDHIDHQTVSSDYQTSSVGIDPSYDIDDTDDIDDITLSSINTYVASMTINEVTTNFQSVSNIAPSATVKTTIDNATTTSNNTNDTLITDEPVPEAGDVCLCPCACVKQPSQEHLDQMLADMIADMQIQKFQTSQTKRKLSSATDLRISSTGIGLVGVFVLTAVFGIIVIGDAKLFMRHTRSAVHRILHNIRRN